MLDSLKYVEKFVIWRHHVYRVEYIAYQLSFPYCYVNQWLNSFALGSSHTIVGKFCNWVYSCKYYATVIFLREIKIAFCNT